MGRGRRRYAGAHRQSFARAVRFWRRDHRPGWRRGHPLPAGLGPADRRARGVAGTHRHEYRGGAAARLRRAARRHVHQAALITYSRDRSRPCQARRTQRSTTSPNPPAAGRSTRRTSWETRTRPTSARRSRAAWTSGCGSSKPTPTGRRRRRGVPQAGRPPGPDSLSVHVTFPALLRLGDVGLLLLRLMVALVFFDSGRNHLRNPAERSKSIGASTGFTVFLGAAEVAGRAGVALGGLPHLPAPGRIPLLLPARPQKRLLWENGVLGGGGGGWAFEPPLVGV